jgi:hypothetical protein
MRPAANVPSPTPPTTAPAVFKVLPSLPCEAADAGQFDRDGQTLNALEMSLLPTT